MNIGIQDASKSDSLIYYSCAAGFVVLWAVGVLAHMSYFLAFGQELVGAIALAGIYLLMIVVALMAVLKWVKKLVAPGIKFSSEIVDQHKMVGAKKINTLERVMVVDKPYLDHKITLERLASRVSMQPRALSAIINLVYGRGFFQYINHYRIEESKQMLRDPVMSQITISKICTLVGFSSKSTFCALFREIEGMTPSKFREQCKS